jgi:hypothetical protein
LVAVAAGAARNPAGKITQVFLKEAERKGAYRFVENDEVAPAAMLRSAQQACVQRAADVPLVWVPVDSSSLVITDPARIKGTGPLGGYATKRGGFYVMSAIAIEPDGVPLGLVGQRYWARPAPARRRRRVRGRKHDARYRRRARRAEQSRLRKRRFEEKETYHWVEAAEQADAAFAEQGQAAKVCFLLDRGADNQDVLTAYIDHDWRFVARVRYDRMLLGGSKLFARLDAAPWLGTYAVQVPARGGRPCRCATLAVRAVRVTLRLVHRTSGRERTVTLGAVEALEVGPHPTGVAPLHWRLLTTEATASLADACHVVNGYSFRWKIEDFHRAWKRGGCHVEDTELRSAKRIERWAIVLSTVALRIARLTHLARETPEAPALREFTQDEIDATILLRKPPGWRPGMQPTLGQVVRWIADEGGYTGRSSGGPPGKTVIGRGLERVATAADVLQAQRRLEAEKQVAERK